MSLFFARNGFCSLPRKRDNYARAVVSRKRRLVNCVIGVLLDGPECARRSRWCGAGISADACMR